MKYTILFFVIYFIILAFFVYQINKIVKKQYGQEIISESNKNNNYGSVHFFIQVGNNRI